METRRGGILKELLIKDTKGCGMRRRGRRRELEIKLVRQLVGMRCLELRQKGYTVTQAAEIINGEFPNLHMSRMTVYRMGEEVLYARPMLR